MATGTSKIQPRFIWIDNTSLIDDDSILVVNANNAAGLEVTASGVSIKIVENHFEFPALSGELKLKGIDAGSTLNTMATQAANAVAITGGTINGTSVGASVASTGRFTTLNTTGDTSLGGDLVVSGDFTVNGTFTTLNTDVWRVEDKNIELGRIKGDGYDGELTTRSTDTSGVFNTSGGSFLEGDRVSISWDGGERNDVLLGDGTFSGGTGDILPVAGTAIIVTEVLYDNVSANGGGITLKGTTDKTINWVNATSAWTSSEHIDLAEGKGYMVNGSAVISASRIGFLDSINLQPSINIANVIANPGIAIINFGELAGRGHLLWQTSDLRLAFAGSTGGLPDQYLDLQAKDYYGNWAGDTIPVNKGGTGTESYTNNQVLIASGSGATLGKSTLTQGSNITITNTAGVLTIATPAEANQNAWGFIAVSGQTTIASAIATDTLNIAATDGITLATNNTSKTLTIGIDEISVNKLGNLAGLSVLGRSVSDAGAMAAITAPFTGDILRRLDNVIGFGKIFASSVSDFEEAVRLTTLDGLGGTSTDLSVSNAAVPEYSLFEGLYYQAGTFNAQPYYLRYSHYTYGIYYTGTEWVMVSDLTIDGPAARGALNINTDVYYYGAGASPTVVTWVASGAPELDPALSPEVVNVSVGLPNVPIVETDTVLEAFAKTQGQIDALSGAIDSIGSATSYSAVVIHRTVGATTSVSLNPDPLPKYPSRVVLLIRGGPNVYYGDDFTVSGSTLSWAGLGLDTILADGDKLTIQYEV